MDWLGKRKKHNTPALTDTETESVMVNPFSNAAATPEHSTETPTLEIEPDLDPELAAANIKLKRKVPHIGQLFDTSHTLLAFQAGSFGLRGALIKNYKHYARIKHVAESSNVDFTRAIHEVLTQLKDHQRLPKRAILLTPSVVSDLVQLPVSPLRPRSNDQMQDLIRWELEGAVTQQNKHWMIGSMLVERGLLTPQERDEVVTELELRQVQGGPASLTRFGDLAVQLGLIAREQLEECFTLQGKLVALDDELIYGWQASESERIEGPSDETLLSQEDDSDSSYPWLVCGMSQTVHRRWIGAFKLNGIHLEGFYPALGSLFSTLWHQNDQQQIVLEIHQEQLALVKGNSRSVSDIITAERQSAAVTLDECLDLIGILPTNVKRLYLAADQDEDLTSLSEGLKTILEMDVQVISSADAATPVSNAICKSNLLGLQGIVNHYLKHTPHARLAWISAKESKEPTWKKLARPKNLAIAAGIILLCSATGFLGWMHWNTGIQQQRLTELNQQFNNEMTVKKQLEAAYNANKALSEQIKETNHQANLTQTLLEEVKRNTSYRIHSLPPLLKAINLSITPDVALLSIQKIEDNLVITAEAIDSSKAQEYVYNLNRFIRPINYQVSNSSDEIDPRGIQKLTISLSYQPGLTQQLFSSSPAGAK